jgi:endonuclease/exonuclease/phosphatase family metal-dependent hydrolase
VQVPLSVVSLNIHAGLGEDGTPRLREQGEAIAALGADVVFLQEVDERTGRSGGVSQVRELATAAGYPFWAYGPAIVHDGGLYGNALLTRTELHDVLTIPFTPARSEAVTHLDGKLRSWPEKLEQRSALTATTTIDGVVTTLVCGHLSIFTAERALAVSQLLSLLPAGPVLAGFDLNVAERHAPEVAALLGTLDELSLTASGLPPDTFPASDPAYAIDIVLGRGWAQGSPVSLHDAGSDHLALSVQVKASTF